MAWHPHKYLPMTVAERDEMLRATGRRTLDELFADIPSSVRLKPPSRSAADARRW